MCEGAIYVLLGISRHPEAAPRVSPERTRRQRRSARSVLTSVRPTPPASLGSRCDIEITGLARCQVKTMWMRGESFGLYEAVVEYFEDDDGAPAAAAEARPGAAVETSEAGATSAGYEAAPASSPTGTTAGGPVAGERATAEGVDGQGSRSQPPSELQQLRVLVRELEERGVGLCPGRCPRKGGNPGLVVLPPLPCCASTSLSSSAWPAKHEEACAASRGTFLTLGSGRRSV